MNLRAIIIDDEPRGISVLKALIGNYSDAVSVVAESTSASKAIDLIDSYRPEIVFLDVQMPEMDGFELLEKIGQRSFHLIFTTAHARYALKALKSDAVDYLLKPIDEEALKAAIDRVKLRYASTEKDHVDYEALLPGLYPDQRNKLLIHSKTGIEYIDLSEVRWIESRSNYTHINFSNSTHLITSKTLKELEGLLCNGRLSFIRVHNSYIINLNSVLRFIKSDDVIVMTDGQKIPLSKSRKPDFFRWLNV